MPAAYVGAHMPVSGGIGNGIRAGKEIGCTAVQVFTSSPQQWKAKEVTDAMVADFVAAKAQTGIDCIVSHDSYLINLCALDPAKREQSIEGLKREIGRCAKYGIPFVVSHMGAHMGQGCDAGLSLVAESARRVLDETPDSVTLLMETTAGQGTCLNCQFEHLATILDSLNGHSRLAICLDTCHIFAAGYDIRTEEDFRKTIEKFDRVVGLDRLKVVHANDSKKGLGTRVDRHDDIGQGEIGEAPFRVLMNDSRFASIPIILETPIENEGHARNLALLRSFAR